MMQFINNAQQFQIQFQQQPKIQRHLEIQLRLKQQGQWLEILFQLQILQQLQEQFKHKQLQRLGPFPQAGTAPVVLRIEPTIKLLSRPFGLGRSLRLVLPLRSSAPLGKSIKCSMPLALL